MLTPSLAATQKVIEFFLSQEDIMYENDQAMGLRLEAEIEELNMLIDEYFLGEFPRVKRFGLPYFTDESLKQYFAYCSGPSLTHIKVRL